MEKTTLRALAVLAIVLALGAGFYAGREVWPADGPFRLSSNGRILLNRRTGETWIESVGQWEVYVLWPGRNDDSHAPAAVAPAGAPR